jgi:hypothetical protein
MRKLEVLADAKREVQRASEPEFGKALYFIITAGTLLWLV